MIEPLCICVLELELGVKQTAYSAVGPLGGPPCSAQNTVSANVSSSRIKKKPNPKRELSEAAGSLNKAVGSRQTCERHHRTFTY